MDLRSQVWSVHADHHEQRKSATKIHPTPFPLFLKRFCAWAGLRALLGLFVLVLGLVRHSIKEGGRGPRVDGAFLFRRS